MIEVSVAGGELVARRRSPLSLRFTNTGEGPCTNVVFKLQLPAGIVLMGGADRVEIPRITAGSTHTHTVTVEAARAGRFALTSTNFSYRDRFDMPVRVPRFRADLVVWPAPAAAAVRQPHGRLGVTHEGGELDLGAWDELRILVTNRTGVALDDVTVAVAGPFASDGKRSRIAVLRDGATARCAFHVNAAQGGRHVPVTVRTSYRHLDESGTIRTRSQEDTLNVVVRATAGPERPAPPTSAVDTILYLAASTRDMPPLGWDEEMREVMERLRRSKHRDRYRIEPAVAARFRDISQALIDHEPQVVHFSGHGDRDGNLYVDGRDGRRDLVAPEGLAALFGQHRSTLRCVVLNACYSVRMAEAVAAQVDHVIGMRYRIGDEAAIEFSVGFYTGLFGGRSVPDAFARGLAHILRLPDLAPEHETPLLFPPGSATAA